MKKLPLACLECQFYAYSLFPANSSASWALLAILQLEMDLGYSLLKTLGLAQCVGRCRHLVVEVGGEGQTADAEAFANGLEPGAACNCSFLL